MHWELLGKFKPGACLSDDKIISLSNYTPITSFMTLPWTLSEAAVKVMSFPWTSLSWVLASLILGFCTLYIVSLVIDALWRGKATRSFDLTALAPARLLNLKYLFVPLLLSAPLFIVGSNIGRWVAVTCINYILIILSKEILFMGRVLSQIFG